MADDDLPSSRQLERALLSFDPSDEDVGRYQFAKVAISDVCSMETKGYTVAEHTRSGGYVIMWRLPAKITA